MPQTLHRPHLTSPPLGSYSSGVYWCLRNCGPCGMKNCINKKPSTNNNQTNTNTFKIRILVQNWRGLGLESAPPRLRTAENKFSRTSWFNLPEKNYGEINHCSCRVNDVMMLYYFQLNQTGAEWILQVDDALDEGWHHVAVVLVIRSWRWPYQLVTLAVFKWPREAGDENVLQNFCLQVLCQSGEFLTTSII